MDLEGILKTLGADVPFDSDGELTSEGATAWEKLMVIVAGLHDIGAIRETPDSIEDYCDKVVELGY